MDALQAVENFLTQTASAGLVLVVGGLLGLGIQRILGHFIKPDYYTRSHGKSNH